MTLIVDILKELFGMFVADTRLTLGILFLVVIAGVLVTALRIEPLLAGGLLLFGCLAILVGAAAREAKGRSSR